jgi:hypothetical protein
VTCDPFREKRTELQTPEYPPPAGILGFVIQRSVPTKVLWKYHQKYYGRIIWSMIYGLDKEVLLIRKI